MPSHILIDTNIWHFAFVKPREDEFAEIHGVAKDVLQELLSDREVRIGMSAYQAGEIIEVLRRSGVNMKTRAGLIRDFGTGKFFVKDLTFDIVRDALTDAAKSDIHVYDYLVAYPLRNIVERIYSADDHFRHEHFGYAEVINPVMPWVLREGIKPFREQQ
ncbi:MAG: hypothetical protein V3T58_00530 [Candidatus Hydrothermarchaeales archaeon]